MKAKAKATTRGAAGEGATAEFARLLGELATLAPDRFEAFGAVFMAETASHRNASMPARKREEAA